MSNNELDSLLAIPSTHLLDDRDGKDGPDVKSTTTLGGLRDAKATVYDFWTTRCTNCPAALDALDSIARRRPSVTFVGVNIDDAGAAREVVAKAASEGRWTSLTHAHLGEDEKEKAKDILGMRTVPFYVVVSEDGKILRHGNPKALPLKTVESLDAALLPAAATSTAREGSYTEVQWHENDAAVANAPPSATVPPAADKETAAAAAAAVSTVGGAGGKAGATLPMECEGGVCKLVRRPKKKEAGPQERALLEKSAALVPSASEAAAVQAVAASRPAVPAATPFAAPSAAAAAAAAAADDRTDPAGVECDGAVCRLVRKPKNTSGQENQDPNDSVAVVATSAAAPAAASQHAAPAASSRTVECDGGVCKLVRKPKSASVRPAAEAAAVEMKGAGGGEAGESPLAVGDAIPALQVVPIDGGAATTVEDIRAGRAAVLDFWTTRCVRCPAALDALDGSAAAAAGVKYIALNLDSLEGARKMVSEGRWPNLSHVFAGGHDDASEALLERFKARAGLKSVPFYVVLARDGRIEQIGGPQAVKFESKAATNNDVAASTSVAAAASPSAPPPNPTDTAASVAAVKGIPTASSFSFTMDEDF